MGTSHARIRYVGNTLQCASHVAAQANRLRFNGSADPSFHLNETMPRQQARKGTIQKAAYNERVVGIAPLSGAEKLVRGCVRTSVRHRTTILDSTTSRLVVMTARTQNEKK